MRIEADPTRMGATRHGSVSASRSSVSWEHRRTFDPRAPDLTQAGEWQAIHGPVGQWHPPSEPLRETAFHVENCRKVIVPGCDPDRSRAGGTSNPPALSFSAEIPNLSTARVSCARASTTKKIGGRDEPTALEAWEETPHRHVSGHHPTPHEKSRQGFPRRPSIVDASRNATASAQACCIPRPRPACPSRAEPRARP